MGGYSAWNQFCSWMNPCRRVAGCQEYHFILDEGNVYRLKPDGTRGVLVKGLPIEPEEILWGGGLVWLIPDLRDSRVLYSLDPVTLEFRAEADFSKILCLYNRIEIKVITTDALFFTARVKGLKDSLFRLDRKTHKMAQIYTTGPGIEIRGFGPDFVWLYDISADAEDLYWIVDGKGYITPLQEHPDIGPLAPLVREALEHRGVCFRYNTEQELLSAACSRICFIDFSTRQLYFSRTGLAEYSVKQEDSIYAFSFGDTDYQSARTVWPSPSDFSKANWPPETNDVYEDHVWDEVLLFDGAHAVGWGMGGSNGGSVQTARGNVIALKGSDWIFQTPEGEVIRLGKFDYTERDCWLLGDELYAVSESGVWYKFHLAHDVPEARKIELTDLRQ